MYLPRVSINPFDTESELMDTRREDYIARAYGDGVLAGLALIAWCMRLFSRYC